MPFIDHFSDLEDPRVQENITHDLLDILFLVIAGILSGAEGWSDIKDFGDKKLTWLRQYREFEHGIPADDTIARIISRLNPDKLIECFIDWANAVRIQNGKDILSIDGKTLRRSFQTGDRKSALHMISVWSDANQMVLGQFKSKGKKNEINTVMDLLDLIDVKDSIVTLDAMGSQSKIAAKIIKQGADYVLPLKDNQKSLYQEAKAYFHKLERDDFRDYAVERYDETEPGHGRIEVRHYTQVKITDWVKKAEKFKGAKTLIKVIRERHIDGKVSIEEQIYISSCELNCKQAANAIRRHWGVENKVHWRMDVVFREDDSRIRRDDGAQNMASLRRFVMNLAGLNNRKMSMRRKLKNCGWDDQFREELLFA